MSRTRTVSVLTATRKFVFNERGWSTDLEVFDRSGRLLDFESSVALPSRLRCGHGFLINRFPDPQSGTLQRPIIVVDPVLRVDVQ